MTVAPSKPAPDVCAEIPAAPRVPDGAGLPPATTPAQAAALAIYLTWLGAFADHDTLVTSRLTDAQHGC